MVEEWKDCKELRPKPKEKWTYVSEKGKAKKHRTEWCAAAIKYRCLRCGRSSNNLKMQGTCGRPTWLREVSKHKLGRWVKTLLGGEKSGSKWRGFNLAQKVFGLYAAKTRTKIDESMQADEHGHERVWEHMKSNLNPRRGRVPAKNARGWKIEGQKKCYQEGMQKASGRV